MTIFFLRSRDEKNTHDQIWKGDQIFDTTSEGWLYLVVGLDLVMGVFAFSWRKIDPKGEQILDLVMDDLLRVTLSRHENTA